MDSNPTDEGLQKAFIFYHMNHHADTIAHAAQARGLKIV